MNNSITVRLDSLGEKERRIRRITHDTDHIKDNFRGITSALDYDITSRSSIRRDIRQIERTLDDLVNESDFLRLTINRTIQGYNQAELDIQQSLSNLDLNHHSNKLGDKPINQPAFNTTTGQSTTASAISVDTQNENVDQLISKVQTTLEDAIGWLMVIPQLIKDSLVDSSWQDNVASGIKDDYKALSQAISNAYNRFIEKAKNIMDSIAKTMSKLFHHDEPQIDMPPTGNQDSTLVNDVDTDDVPNLSDAPLQEPPKDTKIIDVEEEPLIDDAKNTDDIGTEQEPDRMDVDKPIQDTTPTVEEESWNTSLYESSNLYKSKADLIEQITFIDTQKFAWDINNFNKIYANNKATYEDIAKEAGLPPKLVAALHYRESGCNFNTYLHNGDPLGKPTVNVPKGKLFYNFRDSAIDALSEKQYLIDRYQLTADTTDMAAILSFAECYNGLGYYNKDRVSPYVLSGTNVYEKGKYVADGKFDPNTVDAQPGIYLLIKSLKETE